MPRAQEPLADIRGAIDRYLARGGTGAAVLRRGRRVCTAPTAGWLETAVEPGRVLVTCHMPRSAGAGEALALADRVTGLFRGRTLGAVRFGAPSVELDGRDPLVVRAVVALPYSGRPPA